MILKCFIKNKKNKMFTHWTHHVSNSLSGFKGVHQLTISTLSLNPED